MLSLGKIRNIYVGLLLPYCLALAQVHAYRSEEPQENLTAAASVELQGVSPKKPCLARPKISSEDEFTRLMNDTNLAANCTDEFTWLVLAYITRPSMKQRPVMLPDGTKDMSNDEEWETWAADSNLFLTKPPKWEDSREKNGVKLTVGALKSPVKQGEVSSAISGVPADRNSPSTFRAKLFPIGGCVDEQGQCIEIRHNEQDFNSIVKSGLWSLQGLVAASKKKIDDYMPEGQNMDSASIEIKAEWTRLTCNSKASCDQQKQGYHWNYDANGNLYGLIAMHLITKALPSWTWATFEWKNNPGRCDYYGCRDSFGGESIDARVNGTPPGQLYPVQKLSKDVTSLLYGKEQSDWQNYRLKGTQTQFCMNGSKACDDKHATKLGSSVLESNIQGGRASCISCHALASVKEDGNTAIGLYTARARTCGYLGRPEILTGTFPIGFIWSINAAQCDRSVPDPDHLCSAVSQRTLTPAVCPNTETSSSQESP